MSVDSTDNNALQSTFLVFLQQCDCGPQHKKRKSATVKAHVYVIWKWFWEQPTAPYYGFKVTKHTATIYHPPNCLLIEDLSVLIFIIQIVSLIDRVTMAKSGAIN